MKIVEVSERPKEGQFIRIWAHRGKIWADTFQAIDGDELMYDDHSDEFIPSEFHLGDFGDVVKYFISEGGE